MSTIRKKRPTPQPMRKVKAYGEVPGTGIVVDELDDGGMLSAMTSTKTAQVQLNAANLMTFTRELAEIFGHEVIHPQEWRDKIFKIVTAACERNESRCLDDEIDRSVVVADIVEALLAAAALPKSR